MTQIKGYIFDIKKYSINDGPGIRTTVFFKGCPLRCWWCHNPESQKIEPEEFPGCNLRWNLNNIPSKNIIGMEVYAEDVIKEIQKDLPFYEESGGGVTFSGGEPMMQMNFLVSLLNSCITNDINTAVDTTGYTEFSNLEIIYNITDMFLYDLKLMDDKLHIMYTGVSNKTILDNLKKLCEHGNKVILRIPIIPTITDTAQNIDLMMEFISSLKGIRQIDLLPFHKSANSKYERMNRENKLPSLETPSDLEMNNLKNKFSSLGYEVKIGGY